ncbi:MAG: bifunctional diguanylate cyclase/phosphodiesterase [Campylobacterota bacterium]|nr:bifunctional diguanylate cyclase/phosphodiesterase [Campylobacterota bacterium]
MKTNIISNKTLILRIVFAIVAVSLVTLVISTEYLKKTAINTLASDDAKKTAQLVFETMNTRMQEGWTKTDLDKIIDRLEYIRNGMRISSYRSKEVEDIFGVVPRDKKIVENDPLIQKAMNGEEVFLVDEETGIVRFLYPMKTDENCLICHSNTKMGNVNGVLDISFPHSDIKISLDSMSMYIITFFIIFILIFFYIFFLLINKKMVNPIVQLTNEIQDIEKSKDISQKVIINTNIEELIILQNSFNNLLETIKYYYAKMIKKIYTDELTSLPNLAKLQQDLENIDLNSSLIIIDIKSFGKINRVYGIKVADILLQQFSEITKRILQKNGKLYRLYGDEFAIIYNTKVTNDNILYYINKLKEHKFNYKDIEFLIDVTVGYVDTQDGNILENGNIALKSAKQMHKSIMRYDESLAIKDEDNNHMVWLKNLTDALNEDRLVPYFMPMKNTKTNKIDKYETLVRIEQINGDIVTPDKFLDVAVASGLYPLVTQTMIKKTFNYFKDISDIKFSLNVSLSDITNEETTSLLFKSLNEYKNSQNVVIELLETEEISDFVLLNNFINNVKKYGAKVAIDDFGSGYSNFNYILKLDVDIIKLDSSLVENIFTDQNAAVVVSNVVNVLKELGLTVVAEKVATKEIEKILTIHEVDYLQGFYIGKPKSNLLKG